MDRNYARQLNLNSMQIKWFKPRCRALNAIAAHCEIERRQVAKIMVDGETIHPWTGDELLDSIRHVQTSITLHYANPKMEDVKRVKEWREKLEALFNPEFALPDYLENAIERFKVPLNHFSNPDGFGFSEIMASIPNSGIRYPATDWLAIRIATVLIKSGKEAKVPSGNQEAELNAYGRLLAIAFEAFDVRGNHNTIASINAPAKRALAKLNGK
ncbi:hypothetical protein [Amylibacter sp. IMCC11727]|uniref:hypothetical protein n=1 Tax=Amylibacter sp. IMCC11727 TaxID=3039851 RepID=UPI00244E1010|nr:hypothetical protein [Amylibacter sp. IMCC11727]WGI22404.1 hypothetical protein QBD29_03020 [Amylibacter sp. IMCC11727]